MIQDNIHNPLVCFGTLLEDWVMSRTDPTEVKECKTRRYVLANEPVASLFGLTTNNMIGLDIRVLSEINKLNDSFIERINEMDYQVLQKQQMVRFKSVFFTHWKTILIEEITKQPVFNHRREVVAILNYTRDITSSIDLSTLFLHYQSLYCRALKRPQGEAIKAFLKHIDLDRFFMKAPTRQELATLLAMRKHSHTKYIAGELNICNKTVETYKANLRQKLYASDFYMLLVKLRTQHESHLVE